MSEHPLKNLILLLAAQLVVSGDVYLLSTNLGPPSTAAASNVPGIGMREICYIHATLGKTAYHGAVRANVRRPAGLKNKLVE